ncbi:MAG: N-6 DNA methylase [Epsilonproteobacteria bacterium]|nr:MAG: N-6 DNA methylase [Campylobacterota bacterium]
MPNNNILKYESKIWNTADLLRSSGFKESDFPKFMMPFFALAMVESRFIRMAEELRAEVGDDLPTEDFIELIKDSDQGYNIYLFEHQKTLKDICKNDKSFEIDFDAYLGGFDSETKDLLGVDRAEGDKFLDIYGVVRQLKAKKVFYSYVKEWSEVDLKPFNNSEITTLEEHIKRKWADISAETAGEQYTPDDVIALISEIVASKVEDSGEFLKIYDSTCGGGNMLYGVEDRINEKLQRPTATYGQDWNDALFALAKIESRFRQDSHIEYGNTLTDDKHPFEEFDVVVANPPYGVDWKGYKSDILNDKTGRFHDTPAVSDGQLLFMQHLISKMDLGGMGVVVHNGSSLFSGDAGSGESNIRKWMFDQDIVEAIIQLPTDEFFNTGIFTYLWVLNKNKKHPNRVMLVNASDKCIPMKKNKGKKRKEIDEPNRREIVQTLNAFKENEYAKIFDKEFFYFNKQAVQLTNLDYKGKTLESMLKGKKSLKIPYEQLLLGNTLLLDVMEIGASDDRDLKSYHNEYIKPMIKDIDYKESDLTVHCGDVVYWYDREKESIIETDGKKEIELGCGKMLIKSSYKKATKTKEESIGISFELTADYAKDYEIVPYNKDEKKNKKNIDAFMEKYLTKPFVYLDNTVGVEINFNKVFYVPEKLRPLESIVNDLADIEKQLKELEGELGL